MRFHVYSLEQMNGLARWHPAKTFSHAIISVTDPAHTEHGNPIVELPIGPMTKGVLKLRFMDRVGGPDLFDRDMALSILSFVSDQTARGIEAILVHCHAGISRSHAIAAALTKGLYSKDDSFHFQQGNPNMHVYNTMLRAALQWGRAL